MDLKNNEVSVFLSKLMCYNRILIACHRGADEDAIGSMLALGAFLTGRGKTVWMYSSDGCPETCSFLQGSEKVGAVLPEDAMSCELILLVDCSCRDRAGLTEETKSIKNIAIIDHHEHQSVPECSFSLIDPSACSTAFLVYQLIVSADSQPDSGIAEALLTGIVGDTGAFRFSNTTSEVLLVAGKLMEYGAGLQVIIKNVFMSRSRENVYITGCILKDLQYYYEGKLAIAALSESMLAGIDKKELDGIASQQLSGIKNLRMSVFIRELEKNSFRCSLRSDGFVDCCRFASVFGGGGHKNAAGCTIEAASLEEAVNAVLGEVQNWKASFV